MMTNRCRACDVSWSKYQTIKGACCECGGGTVRSHEPPSLDADARYTAAMDKRRAAEAREKVRRDFEEAYFLREMRRNGLDELPVAEPERPIDVQHGEAA